MALEIYKSCYNNVVLHNISPSDRDFNLVGCVYLFVHLDTLQAAGIHLSSYVSTRPSLPVFSVVYVCMLSNAGDIDEFILWCQDGSVVCVLCSFGYHMFDCILAVQTFSVFLSMGTVLWVVILSEYFCTNHDIHIYRITGSFWGKYLLKMAQRMPIPLLVAGGLISYCIE